MDRREFIGQAVALQAGIAFGGAPPAHDRHIAIAPCRWPSVISASTVVVDVGIFDMWANGDNHLYVGFPNRSNVAYSCVPPIIFGTAVAVRVEGHWGCSQYHTTAAICLPCMTASICTEHLTIVDGAVVRRSDVQTRLP